RKPFSAKGLSGPRWGAWSSNVTPSGEGRPTDPRVGHRFNPRGSRHPVSGRSTAQRTTRPHGAKFVRDPARTLKQGPSGSSATHGSVGTDRSPDTTPTSGARPATGQAGRGRPATGRPQGGTMDLREPLGGTPQAPGGVESPPVTEEREKTALV